MSQTGSNLRLAQLHPLRPRSESSNLKLGRIRHLDKLTNHSMTLGQASTNHRAWIVWHNYTTTHTNTQSKCRSPSAFCCRTWKYLTTGWILLKFEAHGSNQDCTKVSTEDDHQWTTLNGRLLQKMKRTYTQPLLGSCSNCKPKLMGASQSAERYQMEYKLRM